MCNFNFKNLFTNNDIVGGVYRITAIQWNNAQTTTHIGTGSGSCTYHTITNTMSINDVNLALFGNVNGLTNPSNINTMCLDRARGHVVLTLRYTIPAQGACPESFDEVTITICPTCNGWDNNPNSCNLELLPGDFVDLHQAPVNIMRNNTWWPSADPNFAACNFTFTSNDDVLLEGGGSVAVESLLNTNTGRFTLPADAALDQPCKELTIATNYNYTGVCSPQVCVNCGNDDTIFRFNIPGCPPDEYCLTPSNYCTGSSQYSQWNRPNNTWGGLIVPISTFIRNASCQTISGPIGGDLIFLGKFDSNNECACGTGTVGGATSGYICSDGPFCTPTLTAPNTPIVMQGNQSIEVGKSFGAGPADADASIGVYSFRFDYVPEVGGVPRLNCRETIDFSIEVIAAPPQGCMKSLCVIPESSTVSNITVQLWPEGNVIIPGPFDLSIPGQHQLLVNTVGSQILANRHPCADDFVFVELCSPNLPSCDDQYSLCIIAEGVGKVDGFGNKSTMLVDGVLKDIDGDSCEGGCVCMSLPCYKSQNGETVSC